MNRYCFNLNLPVNLDFPQYKIADPTVNDHKPYELSRMNKDFLDFIESIGLFVHFGEYFYTAPHSKLHPHTDTTYITDVVKLNWMRGGRDSVMEWYKLNPNKSIVTRKTKINTTFSVAHRQDVQCVHSALIGGPSLVNVGQLHGVINHKEPRHVICAVLGKKRFVERLEWDEAIKIFQKYVV